MKPVASRSIEATIAYLSPTSRTNRFYWAPEGRISTAIKDPHRVTVHDARALDPAPTIARNGFELIRAPTRVTDIHDKDQVQTIYGWEVREIARTLTGANLVLPMGAELRSSAPDRDGMLPPAPSPHVDYDERTARTIAERRYSKNHPDGPGYRRFILFSVWRCLSSPPQDWPLALCDHASSRNDPEIRNVRIVVDRLPMGDEIHAPIGGEDEMGASALFTFNPEHRWYYFPDMTPDEAVFIIFHDSDHSRPWRTLHTAFHDETTPGTITRESIEFRGCAYFTN